MGLVQKGLVKDSARAGPGQVPGWAWARAELAGLDMANEESPCARILVRHRQKTNFPKK